MPITVVHPDGHSEPLLEYINREAHGRYNTDEYLDKKREKTPRK